jgi:cobalamin-dependent methionine synthase I
LFTEQLTAALRASMPAGVAGSPRVLLTTLPGEPHSLGLLMAEAVLRLEGVETLSLGVQTPLGDVLAAAQARRSDIVALSFSSNFPAGVLAEVVAELRQRLPARISLWCGGAGTLRVKRLPEQVVRIGRLEDIPAELALWRKSPQNAAAPA